MDGIPTPDSEFAKQLASGGLSNVLSLVIFGLFYVLVKRCTCKHSKCKTSFFSCESDNKTIRTENDIENPEEDSKSEEKSEKSQEKPSVL